MSMDPWTLISDVSAELAECGGLLRQLRARLVHAHRQAGYTLTDIAQDAGICRQRAAQWQKDKER